MAAVVHLDDVAGVNLRGTATDFVRSLENGKLPKGTFFSGTVHFSDLPTGLVQAEVQGVIGYIASDMLIDMTLTSVAKPNRWTCSFRTGHGGKVTWVERK